MKDQKNIITYGFLVFLLVIGIVSIFHKDTAFINALNTLAVPVFLFTIATLIAKANQFIRNVLVEEANHQEPIDEKYDKLLQRAEEIAHKSNHAVEDEKLVCETRNEAYKSKVYLNAIYKRFLFISKLSSCVNFVAMISFVFCLLSLTGLFSIDASFHWINIFSLALVFFDFFVLEDWLKSYSCKLKKKLSKIVNDEFKKAIKDSNT